MQSTETQRSLCPDRLQQTISRLEDDGGALDKALAAEIAALAKELRLSMRELRQTDPARIGAEFIPTATDELDAIVEVTAKATGTILDACEEIDSATADLGTGPERKSVEAATARIYAACGFQDLTGQRIAKVVDTLRRIDRRVNAVCKAFGLEPEGDGAEAGEAPPAEPSLLNGPSSPEEAMTQNEIDKVLAKQDRDAD